jgi:type 2A phosphatase activator TIP41
VPESQTWKDRIKGEIKCEEYDWTWFTSYTGHITTAATSDSANCSSDSTTSTTADTTDSGDAVWTQCEHSGFDTALLQDSSIPILYFDETVLYEDFIHDHGIVQLSVKVRVMPQCWFVLLRYWLRLDGVMLKVNCYYYTLAVCHSSFQRGHCLCSTVRQREFDTDSMNCAILHVC